jgi:hypothetical protein
VSCRCRVGFGIVLDEDWKKGKADAFGRLGEMEFYDYVVRQAVGGKTNCILNAEEDLKPKTRLESGSVLATTLYRDVLFSFWLLGSC